MSARGARSRKDVVKDIEKKAKKDTGKQKAVESIQRPQDAFDTWASSPSLIPRDTIGSGIFARSITMSSDGSRASAVSRSSANNQNGSRPRLNTINSEESLEFRNIRRSTTSASGSTSQSGGSSQGKEKYQAKGKQTKAPRGRGGGVPVKQSKLAPTSTPELRSETSTSNYTSNGKTWINFQIWQGGGAGFKPYGGFDYDEHMQNGSVLIYFKEEQRSEEHPVPQIRADFDVLQNSGSTWLSNALLYGQIDDDDGDEWSLPGSPESFGSRQLYPSVNHTAGQPDWLRSVSPIGSVSTFNIDQAYFGVPGNGTAARAQYYSGSDRSRNGQPSPSSQRPTHKLWFTVPAHVQAPQAQRLHHVAIRNFIAMLHNKPIVGADVFEMLSTLQSWIEVMYDLDHDNQSRTTSRERSVQMIIEYLRDYQLDDVRNSIKVALGLLAWAEQDGVKWQQGYLESFAHLAGIMSPQIEELPDFKRLSITTRINIGIAAKTLQLRVMEAEEKLGAFDFGNLWEDSAKAVGGSVSQSYQAFRQFLISYYTNIYPNWSPNKGKTWLDREMVQGLQEDFGALYDYMVNRDVVWDSREERPGKKWEMVNRKEEDFRADLPELAITDMLVTFDNRHEYLHIPHPYPLLPREVPQTKKPIHKKSFFGGLKKSKPDVTKDAKAQLQLSIVFSDATNINKADFSHNGSKLIDAFEGFELTTDLKTLTPREARLGRWVLLYNILQVLSTLSVDVHGLRWTADVRNFLCTDLKRCPEWVTCGRTAHMETGQLRSWCWQRSWSSTQNLAAPVELDALEARTGEDFKRHSLLHNDVTRTDEKLEDGGKYRGYGKRVENEKIKQEEFAQTKRLDEDRYWPPPEETTDYGDAESEKEQYVPPMVPPMVPPRSHLRKSNALGTHQFPVPPQGSTNNYLEKE